MGVCGLGMHRKQRLVNKVLREPLLHFSLIGVALFIIYGLVDDRMSGDYDNKVVVSAGRIEQLENIFTKTWQSPPTANDLKRLVDDFVLEEIYYRQAVAMGIDRDDPFGEKQSFGFGSWRRLGVLFPTNELLDVQRLYGR